jgi:hypothetical protein|nr:MAG TPA: hypothetical protein [Caudoviricetes sp.]
MENNNVDGIYGIILNGKVYEVSEGGCFKCAFFHNALIPLSCEAFCVAMPNPNPEKDNCFRFSQELTDKINNK